MLPEGSTERGGRQRLWRVQPQLRTSRGNTAMGTAKPRDTSHREVPHGLHTINARNSTRMAPVALDRKLWQKARQESHHMLQRTFSTVLLQEPENTGASSFRVDSSVIVLSSCQTTIHAHRIDRQKSVPLRCFSRPSSTGVFSAEPVSAQKPTMSFGPGCSPPASRACWRRHDLTQNIRVAHQLNHRRISQNRRSS